MLKLRPKNCKYFTKWRGYAHIRVFAILSHVSNVQCHRLIHIIRPKLKRKQHVLLSSRQSLDILGEIQPIKIYKITLVEKKKNSRFLVRYKI